MPNVVRAHPHLPHVTLNSDGRPHPLLNTLTLITLVFGIVSFALGFVVRAHLAASVLGLVALAIGLYAQMISETREERMLIVTGLVAAFVGVSLGFAHGGFGV
jgi:glucose-6-phosphate-specific signal transduction histidine kinase